MITREQVADLKPGDVVELSRPSTTDDAVTLIVRGPLRQVSTVTGDTLYAGSYCVRDQDGHPVYGPRGTLTVISRAPRPLYVNHHRTEPVPGDTVHPGDGTLSIAFRTVNGWVWPNGTWARVVNDGLRLLVDGESGQVVP